MRVLLPALLAMLTCLGACAQARAETAEPDPLPVIPGVAPEILTALRDFDIERKTTSRLLASRVVRADLDGDGVKDTAFPVWIQRGPREVNALVVALSSQGGRPTRTWVPGNQVSMRAEGGELIVTLEVRPTSSWEKEATGRLDVRYAVGPDGPVRVVPSFQTIETFLHELEQFGIICEAGPATEGSGATCGGRTTLSIHPDTAAVQRAAEKIRATAKPKGRLIEGPNWLVHSVSEGDPLQTIERFLGVGSESLEKSGSGAAAAKPVPAAARGTTMVPVALIKTKMKYPPGLQEAGTEGEVVLESRIDELGFVTVTKVRASPAVGLNRAAIDSVKDWLYAPAMLNGRPQSVYLVIRARFKAGD